ncbi:hypothetical protein HBH70_032440 [Parastagonospora nodorum]|nr:hypothetical protein HBH53_039910 [Parastagonospora nodorum]KAH4296220.1 hypothetical protein HBI01_147770 [Parastagonospora nodorum]KAH4305014.1 hypothetical protein HBI02_127050 [Parastagonospora nodorum]KAH4338820.1 hypothetical protein HBI00_009870 [Parastagonospora nodorum]KAH4367940.1 hypothetical protein HBH94_140020 [Parastagonospora nodorum]
MSDIEKGPDYTHLTNDSVQSFSWAKVTVTVKDRATKESLEILSSVNGCVQAGEVLAIMGPSGSGKTTLLNVLARRSVPKSTVHQDLYINGTPTSLHTFRALSSYVEQEDALLGSLTVRETLYFAAKLALPPSNDRKARIESLLRAFGLQDQAETLIGTPLRKGVSGGQKRRVSVASQLVGGPRILFLDEPTSGLDSAASREVVGVLRGIARKYKVLIIASIHQPSTTTFEMFDKLMLLSKGKVAYNGPVEGVRGYFGGLGYEMPLYTNPAEFLISLVNTDFSSSSQHLSHLQNAWLASPLAVQQTPQTSSIPLLPSTRETASPLLTPLTLIHRSLIKSHRDVIAYALRLGMYLCLALLMGTVWLRLPPTQANIPAFTAAIFFGGAFMSFMAVAYIPAYLEDLALFRKERANGLYGPTAFILSNFLVGVPFLLACAVVFSLVGYWLSGFNPSAKGFGTWVLWLFLDLLAAESLVVLISSLVPIFVVALASTAFANGVWMCVGGFLVQPQSLNVFWRYVFHYIDYQAYVFRGMMVGEFGSRDYSCGEGCRCMYKSRLEEQCLIEGKAVLAQYGFEDEGMEKYVGIMLGIILGYRVLGWVALWARKQ